MSFVIAIPQALLATAGDLTGIGSAISEANEAAALPTTAVLPAAADEISTAISALFGAHARQFQTLGGQAAAFHDAFVQALTGGGVWYAASEAANASALQDLEQAVLNVVNAPAQALLGRPLIGNGANGASGPVGQPGQPGGILWGRGGNGGNGGNGGSSATAALESPTAPVAHPGPAESFWTSPVSPAHSSFYARRVISTITSRSVAPFPE
jgi:hypothetical protein